MTINEEKLTERVWLEVDRVGWLREDVRAYTERTFQKRGLALLTEAELMQFIRHLNSLPAFRC
ncbi:hypothetical protein [Nostoc sp.]|uniref:hypothetical protein n=1 Tax=Nostoc sp. TaxID=1180 RepID=UPI002FFB1E79